MRTIVTIDGIDGSGKSTFARNLKAQLASNGCTATIVSVDDFRRPTSWDTLTVPEVDAYYDTYYDLALAEACMQAFLAGECHRTIPRYDSITERIDGTRDLELAADVAIVEGVFPLRIAAVRSGVHVFLDVSAEEARRRIIARDMHKGRSRAETERRIDRRYFPAQHRYHDAFSPRLRADILIDNERPTSPRVVRRKLDSAPAALRQVLGQSLPC